MASSKGILPLSELRKTNEHDLLGGVCAGTAFRLPADLPAPDDHEQACGACFARFHGSTPSEREPRSWRALSHRPSLMPPRERDIWRGFVGAQAFAHGAAHAVHLATGISRQPGGPWEASAHARAQFAQFCADISHSLPALHHGLACAGFLHGLLEALPDARDPGHPLLPQSKLLLALLAPVDPARPGPKDAQGLECFSEAVVELSKSPSKTSKALRMGSLLEAFELGLCSPPPPQGNTARPARL